MHEYKSSHPWIRFEFNLRQLPQGIWLALGEAASKCEHLASVPLSPDLREKLHQLYLAKGVAATTAIEGNTLPEDVILDQIRERAVVPPSQTYLAIETQNMITAFNSIGKQIAAGAPCRLTVGMIKEFNAMVLSNLILSDEIRPGEIRTHSVGIQVARYKGAPAADCEYLLKRLCDWLDEEFSRVESGDYAIAFGLLKAILAHIYLAWIHPFADGNGRTARLVEFQILLAVGCPSDAAHLMSNYYNKTRTTYYQQLDISSRSNGNIIPFVEYAVSGFIEELRMQVQEIYEYQYDIAFRDFAHSQFRGHLNKAGKRRRRLLLDLAACKNTIPFAAIRELSPALAILYANMTDATISQDLAKLMEMNLAVREESGYRANREAVLSMRAWKRHPIPLTP
jgi:Fic family protein